jgi:lauroyl/myristoyl acyltransferase
MIIKSSSVVCLHRLLIHKGNAGIYYVTRWGGTSQIATRDVGIAAIRALKSTKSVGQIEGSLATDGAIPSLRPLLQTLLRANLIRSVDGVATSTPDFNLMRLGKALCRLYPLPLYLALIRRLPIRIQRRCRYVATYLSSHESMQRRAATAEANIRRTSLEVAKHFKREYLHHLLLNIADSDAVFASTAIEARRWLERSTVWEGFEHIEQARSLGRGVICAGLHFTASRLVAPLLLTRGLNVYMTATPSPSVNVAESVRWHGGFRCIDPGAGEFHQIPQVALTAVKGLFRALSRNDLVLTFPDMHTINPGSDDETRKRCAFFGISSSPFQQPTISVNIAGVEARMNEWAGWLAAQSRAPVVPVALVRTGSGHFVLKFLPPIVCQASHDPVQRAADVNTKLFQVLDHYVRVYPSQWFGWHRFHLQRVTT